MLSKVAVSHCDGPHVEDDLLPHPLLLVQPDAGVNIFCPVSRWLAFKCHLGCDTSDFVVCL